MMISDQVVLVAIFYFGQVFFFLQVNQQKPVGIVTMCKEHTQSLQTFVESTLHYVFD